MVRNSVNMNTSFSARLPSPYLVAVNTGTVASSKRKLSVALDEDPERICGQALRIGYTGSAPTDLALYRLKVKSHSEPSTVTLSNLFVLEHGIFREYEQ